MTRGIVITGASSGLGAALALSYAEPGTRLGLLGRNAARLSAIAQLCRDRGAEPVEGQVDVTDRSAMAAWLSAFEGGGRIDLLIANAGRSSGPAGPAEADGLDGTLGLIRVNLIGVAHAVETVLPWMIARRAGQVALVGSIAGFRGVPDSPAYSATKAAVHAYGDALRGRLAPLGIAVTVISPGFFRSRMSDRYEGSKPLLIEADQAAAIIRRGLDRRAGRIAFPRSLAIGLRLLDFLPWPLADAILRRIRFTILEEATR